MKVLVWSWITFPMTLNIRGNKNKGLWLQDLFKKPFLSSGLRIATFKMLGNLLEVMER